MHATGEGEAGHPHPNYVAVWAVLVALLVLGIAAGFLGHPVLSTVLVFSVATVKALLVAANYMHMKFEPTFVRLIVAGGVICVLIVLFGLVPDIVYVYGD